MNAMKKEYIDPRVEEIEIPTKTLLLTSVTEETIPDEVVDDIIVNAPMYEDYDIEEDVIEYPEH